MAIAHSIQRRFAWVLSTCGWLVFLAHLPALAAEADLPRYGSQIWQMGDGLPYNYVQAIAQTTDGYLWIGTRRGLARFDGVHFTVFNETNTPALHHANITGLRAARDGSLWIATGHGGVTRLKDGRFVHYGKADGLASESELGIILETRDGSIWIATSEGLNRFKDRRFITVGRAEGLSSSVVKWMCEDQQGALWLATANGVDCWRDGRVTRHFDAGIGLLRNNARAIFGDHNDTIWVGVGDNLSRIQNGQVTNFSETGGLAYNIVSAVYEDRLGNLWVGSYGGLSRFIDGKFAPEMNSDGLPYDLVTCIFEDREGDIWVGAKDGLIRLKIKRFTSYTRQQGLTQNNVISILEDRAGTLWTGTWGGGVNCLSNGVITAFTNRTDDSPVLVLSLHEDRSGQLWVGTDFNGGLYAATGTGFRHVPLGEGDPEAAIQVIMEDRRKNLWLGTGSGLYRMTGGVCEPFGKSHGLTADPVRTLFEDHSGNIWIGQSTGLTRKTGDTLTRFTTANGLSHNTVTSIHEDAAGDLWIGTAGGGLNRLRNGKLVSYTTQQGLFNDNICEILEDNYGWLWMSCPQGIFRVSKKNLDDLDRRLVRTVNCVSYGKPDGMISEICNSVGKPSAFKGQDGRFWFATSKGFCVIDPNKETHANEAPPPVIIEQIIADRQFLAVDRATRENRPMRLPPGRGDLEFRYTALSFRVPEKNGFKYRLEGIDADWVDAGAGRLAHYNNLYPGRYRFEVIARNGDGVWNDAGDSVVFVLLPHAWQTWWFHALVMLAAAGLIAAAIRYFIWRKLHLRLQRLEQQHALEKERARIAKDMHDELGASVTQIGLLGERARRDAGKTMETRRHAERISATAIELGRTLDEIVWAVNPKNDTLDNVAAYTALYAEEFFQAADIRCRIDVSPDLPAYPISAEARHNLFLAVKEALNNIVKHAQATEVWLRFAWHDPIFQLSVEDDGRGMPEAPAVPSGNGLFNMRKRMEETGGTFESIRGAEKGTILRFSIKIQA